MPNNTKLLPRWVNFINQQKLERLQFASTKVSHIVEFINNSQVLTLNDIREFDISLKLIEFKLSMIKEVLEKQGPPQVIDTYHLERFFSYASNFHDALVQAHSKGRLLRYFESPRLSASLEKLTLSMHYELNLFFDYIDEMFGGSIKSNPKNKQTLIQFTFGYIQDKDAQAMWRDKFGLDVCVFVSFCFIFRTKLCVIPFCFIFSYLFIH